MKEIVKLDERDLIADLNEKYLEMASILNDFVRENKNLIGYKFNK